MTERERAIQKVVRLAEITVQRGATPAEEETAEGRAKRLIARHALTLGEVEAAATAAEIARRPQVRRPAPMPFAPFQGFGFPQTATTSSGALNHGGTFIWIRLG